MYWKLSKVLEVALAKLCSNSVLVNLNNNNNNNNNNNKNIFIAPIQQ